MDAENPRRRLRKITGRVQAIDRMIDENVPCEDFPALINAESRLFAVAARPFWNDIFGIA